MINSRQKGARVERLAAELLRSLGVTNAKRDAQQYGGGSAEAADLSYEHSALDNIHIEVKGEERPRFYAYIEQSTKDAGSKLPVVLWKQNRKDFILLADAKKIIEYLINLSGVDEKENKGLSEAQVWQMSLKTKIKEFVHVQKMLARKGGS